MPDGILGKNPHILPTLGGGGNAISPYVVYYGAFVSAPSGSTFYPLNTKSNDPTQNVEAQNRVILTKAYKLRRLRMNLLSTIFSGVWGLRVDGVTVASLPLGSSGEIDSGALDITIPAGSAVCFVVTCTLGSGVTSDKAFAELEQIS